MSTQVLRSAGQPLDANTRAFMEPRFGYDFSDVRVHAEFGRDTVGARCTCVGIYSRKPHCIRCRTVFPRKSGNSNRLLAHELAHVVQQGGAGSHEVASGVIQRAGDPAFIPPEFECDTDLSAGRLVGTDLLFGTNKSFIDNAAHDTDLTAFVDSRVAAGGTDDILIHGYASTSGDQALN